MKNDDLSGGCPTDENSENIWFLKGYENGYRFAKEEADFADLAAINRAGGIPIGWDIFRAELRQKHLGQKGFNFQEFAAGFSKACLEFYDQI